MQSFSNRTFDRMPRVVYNALKQNTKPKSICAYFVSITKENNRRSLLISLTFRKFGESEVILTLSIILMKTFVASGLFPKSFFKFLYTTCLRIWNGTFADSLGEYCKRLYSKLFLSQPFLSISILNFSTIFFCSEIRCFPYFPSIPFL